jgi:hypothetical protein
MVPRRCDAHTAAPSSASFAGPVPARHRRRRLPLGVTGCSPLRYSRAMDVLGPATEQDMLDAFVHAERTTRGYPSAGLFCRFPSDCTWVRASLTQAELLQVHHIRNEPTWFKIAGIGRSPAAAVEWVKSHPTDGTALIVSSYHAQFATGLSPRKVRGMSANCQREPTRANGECAGQRQCAPRDATTGLTAH